MSELNERVERSYVSGILTFLGASLEALSRIDPVLQQETASLPVGYSIEIVVYSSNLGFRVEVTPEHTLKKIPVSAQKADLKFMIKHVQLAREILTFQEGLAQAFARNRFLTDGDVGNAIIFMRLLNRLQTIALPKVIAQKAVKEYPSQLKLTEKLPLVLRMFAGMTTAKLKTYAAQRV